MHSLTCGSSKNDRGSRHASSPPVCSTTTAWRCCPAPISDRVAPAICVCRAPCRRPISTSRSTASANVSATSRSLLRPMEASMSVRKVTVATLAALKARNEKAVFVTAYDYQTADETAIRSAGAFIAAGCDAVKCEGGSRVARRVRAMVDAGIAVMGHLGLTPQSMGQLGGYRVQGKCLAAAERLLRDAEALERAGAFSILLEAVPAETAAFVRERVGVLLYGIGAGPHVDGQLVISHDMLGNFVGEIAPRFVKRYAEVGGVVEGAFRDYARDVRAGVFPGPEHCYQIDPADEALIRAARTTRTVRPASR